MARRPLISPLHHDARAQWIAEDAPQPTRSRIGDVETVDVADDLHWLRAGRDPIEVDHHSVEPILEQLGVGAKRVEPALLREPRSTRLVDLRERGRDLRARARGIRGFPFGETVRGREAVLRG